MDEGKVMVHTVFREAPFPMPADEAEVLRKQGLLREPPPGDPVPAAGSPGVTVTDSTGTSTPGKAPAKEAVK